MLFHVFAGSFDHAVDICIPTINDFIRAFITMLPKVTSDGGKPTLVRAGDFNRRTFILVFSHNVVVYIHFVTVGALILAFWAFILEMVL